MRHLPPEIHADTAGEAAVADECICQFEAIHRQIEIGRQMQVATGQMNALPALGLAGRRVLTVQVQLHAFCFYRNAAVTQQYGRQIEAGAGTQGEVATIVDTDIQRGQIDL
jgi:hypothetical protein